MDPTMYPMGSQSIKSTDVETSPTTTDLILTFNASKTNEMKAISIANLLANMDSATTFGATVTVGEDDTGYDVKFFGATSGKYWLWDESADQMTVVGASQFSGAVTVGVDDTGYDVKLFGATASAYLLWDESADALVFAGDSLLDLSSMTGKAANATSGACIKAGTSGSPVTEDTADTKFASLYWDCGATSGDSRGIYNRLYITGAGGGGESLRSFTTVNDVAGATAHGAHLSLNFGSTGSITGLGVAVRSTLHVPNAAMSGGTYGALQAEVWSDGSSSDMSGTTSFGFLRVVAGGDATGAAVVDANANLIVFDGVTAGSGNLINTDITTHTAYGGIPVYIPGVGVRYLALVAD